MNGRKRNWKEMDYSDEDEPSFGKQILPVARLPDSFDKEPMDGLEYLFTVRCDSLPVYTFLCSLIPSLCPRRDARQLPHVTRVVNPYEFPEPPEVAPQSDPGSHPPTSTTADALPSNQWRQVFLRRFKNFQKNVNQPTIHVQHVNPKTKIMPDKKARDLWWAFLAGKPESDWDPPKLPKRTAPKKRGTTKMRAFAESDSEEELEDTEDRISPHETWAINEDGEVELIAADDVVDSLPAPSSTPGPDMATEQKEAVSDRVEAPSQTISQHDVPPRLAPREPTPTMLRRIDHRTSLHLLMYFTHWINVHLSQPNSPSLAVTESHASWMFALLSKIEEHISADDMSLLRNLARACLGLLKESMQNDKALGVRCTGSTGDTDVSPQSGQQLMSASSCWMILTAVIEIWGQKDLWVDAEAMLASV
ncbi:hypothetical protein SERLA73DRAFT_177959 [Serpula lacrymans var. lacrymans S7.3]|uniref:Uncharacterized protein n=2 Tax=Serpula lacrymans var. lacrymans TaxID=341189 RepID=F8PQ65_SERL3|nr:uncharacterized protein SERLADRAFT_461837 [Serpula lacrymans var. lacrymans S7.9]EGO02166.1 hypothetical protein SERLA73DRAFT_177959 [Serpula lacrymans var. lacrymans S7.3]EGO27789.1 hypothetical protein SERLADRAFT_461837 [Serpula lacrymans var. lacrymans S7.9]